MDDCLRELSILRNINDVKLYFTPSPSPRAECGAFTEFEEVITQVSDSHQRLTMHRLFQI